ncbi:MlaD family protein [Patulibacter sp. NPDC049589]|uniref:MlaD family protein n=1 Tax=Patulibacter sp. NPDC049589 TaxID=3154731 RepID=UPI0034368058
MPDRRVLLAVALVVLGAVVIFAAGWIRIGGGVPLRAAPYEATVRLPDASGLIRGAEVQISGVPVGKVGSVRPTAAGGDVVLRIDARYAPLPADTRVTLRTRTALGERFVGLSPGTPGGRTIPDRGRIPTAQVETVPTVGDVLGTLDARTRKAVRRLTGTLQTALKGRGAGLADALGELPDASAQLAAITTLVDGRRDRVASLVRNGDAVLAAVVRSRDDLGGLTRDARAVVDETGARTRALSRTVDLLPGFIDRATDTLVRAERLATTSAPVVRRLTAAAPSLPRAQDAAAELLPEVAELLHVARPQIRRARRVLPAAEDVLARAGRTLPPLREVTRQIPPFFGLLSAYRTQLVSWAAKLGALTQPSLPGAGGPQHYARLAAILPNEPLLGNAARQPHTRTNAYPAPGAFSDLEDSVPKSFDCRGAAGLPTFPPLGATAPCVQAPPWTLDGNTASYQRLLPRP